MLNELAEEIRNVNRANGWDVFQRPEWDGNHKIPAILALIHSEVSEALEDFRDDDPEHFLEELADVLIRVLSCAGGFPRDFDEIVRNKIEFNKTRDYHHGGKRI